MLSKVDLAIANQVVRNTLDGIYELAELYGPQKWKRVAHPTRHGIAFRKSAAAGAIGGVLVGPKTAQNHRTYIVLNRD